MNKMTMIAAVAFFSCQAYAEVTRKDFGWGGATGGNLEMYSKTDASRAGELRFVYGGGDFGSIMFFHYNGSSWTQRTSIDKNGNWNMGATTPCADCRLTVNGKIRAKEIIVDSGWADYVFKPSYELRPLEDVATYIKTHNHLPGMPSEKSIQENGVDLAKFNVKLLEKVEEITLYMIDIKKENEALKQEIAELKQAKVQH